MAKKILTVGVLRSKLKEFSPDMEVYFYESGSIYDTRVTRVYVSEYDKKHSKKPGRVTLS